jgi:exonuclease VII small subunit
MLGNYFNALLSQLSLSIIRMERPEKRLEIAEVIISLENGKDRLELIG